MRDAMPAILYRAVRGFRAAGGLIAVRLTAFVKPLRQCHSSMVIANMAILDCRNP
jgi:hypothetical protein